MLTVIKSTTIKQKSHSCTCDHFQLKCLESDLFTDEPKENKDRFFQFTLYLFHCDSLKILLFYNPNIHDDIYLPAMAQNMFWVTTIIIISHEQIWKIYFTWCTVQHHTQVFCVRKWLVVNRIIHQTHTDTLITQDNIFNHTNTITLAAWGHARLENNSMMELWSKRSALELQGTNNITIWELKSTWNVIYNSFWHIKW